MIGTPSPEADAVESGARRRTAAKVKHRRELILEWLASRKQFTVEELTTDLGASPATVRRDIRSLQRDGLIRREHGLVALAESVAFQPFLDDPGFRDQIHHMAAEKRRIGVAAGAMIRDGETIGIAPGTTSSQVARALKSKRGLTVVTNALNVAMELSRSSECRLHLTGGYLSGDWFAMVGPRALDFIRTMFTDWFFFGANGIHSERGVTDRHTEEAAVNQAMARQARKRVLVADHTKFGQIANCFVCAIPDLDAIITDAGASDELIAPFLAFGIEVLRV